MSILVGGVLATLMVRAKAYSVTYNARFDQWFQQFSNNMEDAMRDSCQSNYTEYKTVAENREYPENIASNLIDCLLTAPALTEAIKANMTSAQVLLGLLPTILTTVGCDPAETSVLGLRRPMLAMLVTIGSPAPSPIRSFIYYSPVKMLKPEDEDETVHVPDVTSPRVPQNNRTAPMEPWGCWGAIGMKSRQRIVMIVQLLIVVAAVVNNIELALEMGFLTISSFAPSRPWLVILWTILGVFVHVCGRIALYLRMEIRKEGRDGQHDRQRGFTYAAFVEAMRDEFSLCSTHTGTVIRWKSYESRWFVFLAWFTANGIAVLIVYGTIVFSSMMFISTQDAILIFLRYLISAFVCRAILMSELGGMRKASKQAMIRDAADHHTTKHAVHMYSSK